MVIFEKPRDILFTLLLDQGITSIGSKIKAKELPVLNNKFQQLITHMLLYDKTIKIVKEGGWCPLYSETWNNKVFTLCRRNVRVYMNTSSVDSVYPHEKGEGLMIELKHLLSLLPQPVKPIFIVDLRYWDLLLDKERNLLLTQLSFSLSILREYLWDLNLVITSAPKGIIDRIKQFMGHNKVQIYVEGPERVLENYKSDKVIVLDPNAPRQLTSKDLDEIEVYILGGIVDKIIPRQGLTSTLAKELGLETRKVTLRGSTIGVPCRINKIIEIILRAKYDTPKDIDLAIKLSQSRIDARWRAHKEIIEYAKKYGRFTIPKELYYELSKWLNLTWKDFIQAVKMAGMEIK